MSLKRIKVVEITPLGSAIAAASGVAFVAPAVIMGTHSASASTDFGSSVYLQSRDRIYTVGRHSGPQPWCVFKLDPDFFLTSPADGVLAGTGTGQIGAATGDALLAAGQFNPNTGQQPLYFSRGFGIPFASVNPDTLVAGGGAAFTGPNGDVVPSGSDLVSGEGSWTNTPIRRWLCFEGLTDGIPGETLLTGPNVYPSGLMLIRTGSVTIGGVSRNNCWIWVDLRTRRAIGRLGGFAPTTFPAKALSGPSGAEDQTEPTIGGETIDWAPAQFCADPDSGYTQPKGVLFTHSWFMLPSNAASILDPVPGDVFRIYVRLTDFNPYGLPSAQGIPTRTHGRIRLTSRMIQDRSPIYGVAGAEELKGNTNYTTPSYDPLRRRFVHFGHRNIVPLRAQVGDNFVGLFSENVDPVIVSAPAARSIPRTGDVTDYECFVGGDLAEPGVGLSVQWTLTRRSTEGELLTITGGAGTTSTLAHPPVDVDVSGVPDLSIVADGAPLALTTDYTIVAATGVITWVTSQAGKTVLATYKHRATDATPPHGTLLVGQSQTDENGIARAQVVNPDDDGIVGTIDALATQAV